MQKTHRQVQVMIPVVRQVKLRLFTKLIPVQQQAFLFFNHARRGLESLHGAQLKWPSLFAIPMALPRPANPVQPMVMTIKRIQIVLSILMSELPIASQLSLAEPPPTSCHDSCCSGHQHAAPPVKKQQQPAQPALVPPPAEKKAQNSSEPAAPKKRTKIAFVMSNSIDIPSL